MHKYPIKLKPADYPLMTKQNLFSQNDDKESFNSADEEKAQKWIKCLIKSLIEITAEMKCVYILKRTGLKLKKNSNLQAYLSYKNK